MITHEQIPDFYDWLSRYVQLSNWLSYRDRFAAFTMHKRLCVPTQAGGRTAGLEYVNDRLLEVAGLPPEPRVLDAGCGFGGTVFHWQRRIGGSYDGLTLSPVQLGVARREARRRGIEDSCRFHLQSDDAVLERDFDAVIAIESLIHSADLDRTVPNLASALRPGGVLLIRDDMARGDLDRVRPAEAALLRAHWGCARYPTQDSY
ncbi:MAG: SAM-dependent methyltransferase, partial [Gammaproteobacteria bacterium]